MTASDKSKRSTNKSQRPDKSSGKGGGKGKHSAQSNDVLHLEENANNQDVTIKAPSVSLLMQKKYEIRQHVSYSEILKNNLHSFPNETLYPNARWPPEGYKPTQKESVTKDKKTGTTTVVKESRFAAKLRDRLTIEGAILNKVVFFFCMPIAGMAGLEFCRVIGLRLLYVNDYPKIDLAVMTAASVLHTFTDAWIQPQVGNLSDTLRSKSGRRKPFIRLGTFALPIIYFFLFFPPYMGWAFWNQYSSTQATVSAVWFFVFGFASKLISSCVYIPYVAWSLEFTPNPIERVRLFMYAFLSFVLGVILAVIF
jgi:hypothetical protein